MSSENNREMPTAAAGSRSSAPVLIVPYMWIGDFVRGHSVVKLLKSQNFDRPVDILATSLVAPLADYMPGVRKAMVEDLPRSRLAIGQQFAFARRLKAEAYGQVLVMPRTWKATLAPALAGIPVRTGFVGELRYGLLNDVRYGERALPRMIDQCAALALPAGAKPPADWPLPELAVPEAEIAAWRARLGLPFSGRRIVALAPGAVGPSKRWPASEFGKLTAMLEREGCEVWIVGGPGEKALAQEIAAGRANARDLTGNDLRNAILALAAADAAVSNDSGLLHVAAAIVRNPSGTITPSIGIFGPTSPWHWAPLNPLAGVVQADIELDCRPCHKPTCRMGHHLCMREISADKVAGLVRSALDSRATAVSQHSNS
jgi:heptosyltransferase-2